MSSAGNPLSLLLPEDSGWEYGSVLPLARNKRTGKLALAVPEALRGAVNDLGIALQAPKAAAEGELTGPQMAAVAPQMALALAGMGGMGEAPEGALRIFAGRTARTADTQALAKAMTMHSQGEPPEEIWRTTGWMQGPDQQWRFEIPDQGARVNPGMELPEDMNPLRNSDMQGLAPGEWALLGDMFQHKALFKAYPELEKMMVKGPEETASYKGAFIPSTNSIELAPGSTKDFLSTGLHEIQHAIQEREGFATGGSPDDFLSPDWKNAFFKHRQQMEDLHSQMRQVGVEPDEVSYGLFREKAGYPPEGPSSQHLSDLQMLDPDLFEKYKLWKERDAQFLQQSVNAKQKYMNLAGEVEARNVQERHATGETGYPPATPGYTPFASQIVRMGPQGPQATHQLIPVDYDPFTLEDLP